MIPEDTISPVLQNRDAIPEQLQKGAVSC